MSTIEDVRMWAKRDLCRFKTNCIIDENLPTTSPFSWNFSVFSFRYQYKFSVYCTESTDKMEKISYLGCIAVARASLAGETHFRGNDLYDGPCCEFTWNRILAEIVAYELVDVFPPAKTVLMAIPSNDDSIIDVA
jgi:hypothetical protein